MDAVLEQKVGQIDTKVVNSNKINKITIYHILAALIVISIIIMMVKWKMAVFGYIYGIVLALIIGYIFGYPHTENAYEVLQCFTCFAGVGAIIGFICALMLRGDEGFGKYILALIAVPIIEFVVGVIIVIIGGIVILLTNGQLINSIVSIVLMLGLIGGFGAGGGGSILILFYW